MASSHLKQRGGTWYVRVSVPRPLRETVGRAEFVRTTGTSDRRLADRLKYQIIADIQNEINTLADNDPSSPTWLERQALGLRKAVTRGDLDGDFASEIMSDMREKHTGAGGTNTVAQQRHATRLAGDMEYLPVTEVVEMYLAEKKSVVQHSTYALKERMLNEFCAWLPSGSGGASSINEVTRKMAGSYVSGVLVGNGKHPTTNKDTIVHLSGFFNWAAQRGLYEHANPWIGMSKSIATSKRGTKMQLRRWTDAELTDLFDTIPAGEKYYLKEVCALGLYTGARLNEICELEVTDVNLDSNVIHISEGKTQSSVRDIPIHPKLLPVIKRLIGKRTDGYLFETLKPAGKDKKRGHEVSKRFGYWRDQAFPDTLHTINERGHKRSEVNFHSFRRAMINACELAGIPEPTTKQIVGHAKSSLTYGTYSRGVDLKLLREAIEKVDFKGVNFND
jgi:integrase